MLQVERFDGSRWSDETTLPGDGLNATAAVAVGSRIFVIGGFKTSTNVPTSDVLIYDTRSHAWSNAPPMPDLTDLLPSGPPHKPEAQARGPAP